MRSFRFGRPQRNVPPTPIDTGFQPQPDPYFQSGDNNSRPVGFGTGSAVESPVTSTPVRSMPQTSFQPRTSSQPQLQRVPESEIDVEAWPYAQGDSRQPVAMGAGGGIVPQNYQPAVHGLPEQDARGERLTVQLPAENQRPVGFQPAQTVGQEPAAMVQQDRRPQPRRRQVNAPDYRSVSHGHTLPRQPSVQSYGRPEFTEAPVIDRRPSNGYGYESAGPSPGHSPGGYVERPIRARNFR